jgi:very-short-patch-repair endonuclease
MTEKRLRITRGQYVAREKLALARQFRKNPTPDERILWKALRSDALAGLHFRRQQVISGFVVDFYCAVAELAVELDGAVHAGQAVEDGNRDRALGSIGIRTLRIASSRVRNELPKVLAEIRVACTKA